MQNISNRIKHFFIVFLDAWVILCLMTFFINGTSEWPFILRLIPFILLLFWCKQIIGLYRKLYPKIYGYRLPVFITAFIAAVIYGVYADRKEDDKNLPILQGYEQILAAGDVEKILELESAPKIEFHTIENQKRLEAYQTRLKVALEQPNVKALAEKHEAAKQEAQREELLKTADQYFREKDYGSAYSVLERIQPENQQYKAAQEKMKEIKAAVKRGQDEQEKLNIAERRDFAKKLEILFLDESVDAEVETSGQDATVIIISWGGMSRVFGYQRMNDRSFRLTLVGLGFKKAVFKNSITGTSWTWNI